MIRQSRNNALATVISMEAIGLDKSPCQFAIDLDSAPRFHSLCFN